MQCTTCDGDLKPAEREGWTGPVPCDYAGCVVGMTHTAYVHVSLAKAATCPDYADPMPL